MEFKQIKSLRGEINVPGDKSISHRSVMFGALAKGTTEVTHFLQGADCLSTITCFKKLGIPIENTSACVRIHGQGLRGLKPAADILDVGNSGTALRMISGILAAQSFDTTLTGDSSIQKRPMRRISDPLSQMGARIQSLNDNGCAPLKIYGQPLKAIHYCSPVASAQVKSAILLAGLYADGQTRVTEPTVSRNHTELMLKSFGAQLHTQETTVTIEPAEELYAQQITVPGDISSAAYFIAAGLMIPNSQITIKNVGINSTRDGIIRVCQAMGADIKLENIRFAGKEPVADITVASSNLKAAIIEGDIIPTLIDELPMIAIMACFAQGTTIIRDARELRVKESDRIAVMVDNLTAMGADITGTEDGMIIHGGRPLTGAVIESHHDHRIAMSFAIAALGAQGITTIRNAECVNISYPEFYSDLEGLSK